MQWKVVPWTAEERRESDRKLTGEVSGLVCFPWREEQRDKHQHSRFQQQGGQQQVTDVWFSCSGHVTRRTLLYPA